MRDWGFASLLQVTCPLKPVYTILNCFTGIGGLIGMTLPSLSELLRRILNY